MANPHFIRVSARCSGHNLLVCFMEAGLGANETVTITASALATATYVCMNRGGRQPAAPNKITIVEEVSVSQDFTSDQNGQVRGCLVVPVPSPGDFSCPPGQTLVLESVSFMDIEITDETNDLTVMIPGTFSCA